jgi:hypothetical protein
METYCVVSQNKYIEPILIEYLFSAKYEFIIIMQSNFCWYH